MPYLEQYARDSLEAGALPSTPGHLNYVITKIINLYFKARGNYQAANDVIGALEGAKLEFYRRHVAPYEDLKIEENGDV